MIINGILFETALIEKLYRCCNRDYDKAEEDINTGRLKATHDQNGTIYVRLCGYDVINGNEMVVCEDGALITNEEKIRDIFN